MQKLISKYSLAAHLGLLLAAPLFLYPYAGMHAVNVALLVGSLFVAVWMIMEPSRRHGEMLHDARWRIQWTLVRSPLLYSFLVLVTYSLFIHLNSGLEFAFDMEEGTWKVGGARFPGLPASVGVCAGPALAAAVAAMTAGLAARFGLGRGARSAFLFIFSLAAGIGGMALAVSLVHGDNARIVALVRSSAEGGSFVGCGFALAFLSGIATIPSALERAWTMVAILSIPAIGGSFTGMFLCSTMAEMVVFSSAAAILLICALVYCIFAVRGPGALKCLVMFAVSVTAGVSFLLSMAPGWSGAVRIDQLLNFAIFPRDFMQIRGAIDAAALKGWSTAVWPGTGVGTFGWQLRLHALPDDWLVIPQLAASSFNGWVTALTERGFIGAIACAVPAVAVFSEWVCRYSVAASMECDRSRGGELFRLVDPQGWLGPIAAIAVAVSALFGEAPFSPLTLMILMVLSTFSINVFRTTGISAVESKSGR